MKKLIFSVTAKDCAWSYFRASGAGGQKRNKTSSAVLCQHMPSGASGKCSEHREQRRNKETAFERMAKSKKFQDWLHIESCRRLGIIEEIERTVDKAMEPHNLKVEVKDEKGRWVEWIDETSEDAA